MLNHEAYIHVATSLNGRAQTDLPILGIGHPGTTRTQEGLAVFAEIISGTMELDRGNTLVRMNSNCKETAPKPLMNAPLYEGNRPYARSIGLSSVTRSR